MCLIECLLSLILINSAFSIIIQRFCLNGAMHCIEMARYAVLYSTSRCHC